MADINSKSYWNTRFSSGDWERKNGRSQTENFAKAQTRYFALQHTFRGRIVDFGCGLGDAIPVYRKHFPHARLIGLDFSAVAIQECKRKYGHIAEFVCGEADSVPMSEVIVASNVLEHLQDDEALVHLLLEKCKFLYIIVPYKEVIGSINEHIRSYDENSFKNFTPSVRIFPAKGWSQYGKSLYLDIYIKNILRPLFRKNRVRRNKQIMFQMRGLAPGFL